MPPLNTDKFKKVAPNTGWQLDASGIANAGSTSFGLVSAVAIPTDTAVIVTVDRVDAGGNKTPAKMERIIGVMSGNTVTSCVRGAGGTAQAHSGGAVVEIVVSDDNINDMIDGILAEHNQDGSHKAPSTAKTTPVDADVMTIFDSAASFVFKKITLLALKLAIFAGIKPAEGTVWNGKILPTVTSNNLTLSLKTLAGNDPSASDPVYVTIGGVVRTITSALSTTRNAAATWFNAASSELAGKEIDYFAYLGYNATDGVTIGFARIPFATQYSDFSTTPSNEKYCAISVTTNAAATDSYNVIGRFAATLASGTGYWSVPAFTPINLIQRPIFETRRLSYTATVTGLSPISGQTWSYRIIGANLYAEIYCWGTSNATTFTVTLPLSVGPLSATTLSVFAKTTDAGAQGAGLATLNANSNVVNLFKTAASGAFTASGVKSLETTSVTATLI